MSAYDGRTDRLKAHNSIALGTALGRWRAIKILSDVRQTCT